VFDANFERALTVPRDALVRFLKLDDTTAHRMDPGFDEDMAVRRLLTRKSDAGAPSPARSRSHSFEAEGPVMTRGMRKRKPSSNWRRNQMIEEAFQDQPPDQTVMWKRLKEHTAPDDGKGRKRLRLMRASGPETAAWREEIIPRVVSEAKHRDRLLMGAFDHWKQLRADNLRRKGLCIGSQCPICGGSACEGHH